MALSPHIAIDVYTYGSNPQKMMNLYDSSMETPGQAFDIIHTNEITGWQELTFTLPYMVDNEYNHRWDYVKADYKVRLTVGNTKEWFYIKQPKGVRNSKQINRTVKCVAECDILKTKNIYADFDDENGIGTLQELAERVLAGTGWSYSTDSDVPLEADGETVKVRSLTASNKPGAYKLITNLCDLFKVYPVFDSENHEVCFYGLQNRDIHREFMVGGASKEGADVRGGGSVVGVGVIGIMIVGYDGREMFLHDGDLDVSAYGVNALTVEYDANSVITRMYVEGQYGEDGYVGIDDVNPTGLSYIMNFDYYREIGLFGEDQEEALSDYLAQMQASVQAIQQYQAAIATKSNQLNSLWGTWNFVELVLSGGEITKKIYSGIATAETHGQIKRGDVLLICGRDNGEYTYRYEVVLDPNDLPFELTDEYAVKFILATAHDVPTVIFEREPYVPYSVGDMWWDEENRIIRYARVAKTAQETYSVGDWVEAEYFQPSGTVGFKEVSVTAKEAAISEIGRDLAIVEAAIAEFIQQGIDPPQSLLDERTRYLAEQATLRAEITNIYDGNDGSTSGSTEVTGLKELTYDAMALCDEIDEGKLTLATLQSGQATEEETFVAEMGDFLKDGRWSNNNYVLGQEEALYADAQEVLASMCRPSVKYTVQRANLSYNLGYEVEDFRINSQIRLWDPYLGVNDLVYIKKITKYYDAPWKDTVEIANESDIRISGKSLDATLQRIATLANGLDQKEALYDRAKAINSNGSIQADKLEGIIDLQRQKIESAISGWYTDDNGNIIFLSADGQGAMKLTGEGFAIAGEKNDDGTWNWRTFGNYHGFNADLIVTGLLNANLIEAGSITTAKLDAGVGGELDISANKSIQLTVGGNKTLQETIEDINDAVEDIEVGGTNLIRNTLNPSAVSGKRPAINGLVAGEASDSASSSTLSTVEHGICSTKNTSGSPFPKIMFGSTSPYGMMGLEKGETYTFSCDAEYKFLSTGSPTRGSVVFQIIVKPTSGGPAYYVDKTLANYTEYGQVNTLRIEESFTVPTGDNYTGLTIAVLTDGRPSSSCATGDYIALKNLKLEKGNVVSDWSPAPDDISQSITDVETQVATKPTSFTTYFRRSTSATNLLPADGTSQATGDYAWSTTAPAHVDGEYMWQKTITTYTNLPDVVAGPTCISGADGAQGTSVTITSQNTMYAVGASNTSPPSTGWADADHIPTPTDLLPYLWTRTTVNYSTGTGTEQTISYSISKQGNDGDGIYSITPQYTIDTQGTTAPTGVTWYDSYPAMVQAIGSWSYGEYLWVRNKIIKEVDGVPQTANPEFSDPYCDPSWMAVDNVTVGADNLLTGTKNTLTQYPLRADGNYMWYTFIPIVTASYPATEPTWTFTDESDVGTGNTDAYQNEHTYTFRVWIQNNITINAPNHSEVTTYAAGIRVTNTDTQEVTDTLANVSNTRNGWQTVSVTLPDTGNYTVQAFIRRVNGSLNLVAFKCPKLELGNKATEWCVSSSELNMDVLRALEEDLQEQIDGQLITWYYEGTPTTSNLPASEWTTDALKEAHLGDTYYDLTNERAYQWVVDDNDNYSWSEIEVTAVIQALADAHNAQTTADNKRRIFTAQPTPPYDIGDLWVIPGATAADATEIKYCTTKRSSGSYVAADWVQAATDDTLAKTKIYAIQVEYRLSDSETSLVPSDAQATGDYVWNTVAPEWADGKYMWQRTGKKTSETGSFTYSNPTCISGAVGPRGDNGKSVASVVNYYCATNSSAVPSKTPLSSWSTDISLVAFSSSAQYLWNFERSLAADSTELTSTTPSIIAVWGDNNATVRSIVEYYRLSTGTDPDNSQGSWVGSWSTTIPTMSANNKYLWNRERLIYMTDSQYYYETTPKIIGTYGVTIDNVKYQKSTSGSTPPSTWQDGVPATGPGEYLWTKITYSDGSIEYKVSYQNSNGRGITDTKAQYAMIASKDPTDLSENDWVDDYSDLDPWSYGMYLWTRTVVTYSDGAEDKLEPSCDTSWEVIDDVEVNGDNLLCWTQRGTSDVYTASVNLTKSLNDATQYTRIDMLDVDGSSTPAVTQWVVFRTFITPVNSDGGTTSNWKATIRFYPTNGGTATVSDFTVGKNTVGIQGSGYVDFVATPAATTDNGWATVTVRAPSYNYEIEAWIIKNSNVASDAVIYASPKLEFGMVPTQWCKNANEIAAELAELNTVTSTQSQSIVNINQDIVTLGNQYTALNSANGQLAERVGLVETEAGQVRLIAEETQREYTQLGERVSQFETRVVIDPQDGLVLKQSQNPAYVARLKSDHLEFINSNDLESQTYDPVASFGADGALIDKVRSREKLSVGTEDYGWFEMTVMRNGLADKWRNGTNTSKVNAFISAEPQIVYVADGGDIDNGYGSDVTFTISVEGASTVPTYQWQYRYLSDTSDWTAVVSTSQSSSDHIAVTSTLTGSTYTFASTQNTLGMEFRCVVNGTMYSRSVRYFVTGAPSIGILLPASSSTAISLSCCAFGDMNGNYQPDSYLWQHKGSESANWAYFTDNNQPYEPWTHRTLYIDDSTLARADCAFVRCVAFCDDAAVVTNEIRLG